LGNNYGMFEESILSDLQALPLAQADIAYAAAFLPAAQADALSALSNLGYAPGEAAAVVAQLSGEMSGADSASLIRAALKKMAPKT